MESLETYARYPFLSGAKKYVESLDLTLSEIIEHPVYSASVEAARSRIIDALNNRLQAKHGEGVELEISVLSYPLARIIANLTKNRRVIRKYAAGEAGRAHELFRGENKDVLNDVKKDLKFPVEESGIGFRDYLPLAAGLSRLDPRFKLSNRTLADGRISLSAQEELLLLREAVRLRTEEPLDAGKAPKKLAEIAEKIKSAAGFSETRITAKELEGMQFPPCIKHMMSLLEDGDSPHNVMFILGTYFINLGLTAEETVELFRPFPNFSEEKTRYQLDFLSGERGSTRYSCPTCAKIRSYGLCEWDCRVKHPLQYKRRV